MKFSRYFWALLAASVILGSLATDPLGAFPPRGAAAPGVGYSAYPAIVEYWAFPPYVAPFPEYGILPPPLASMHGYGYGHGYGYDSGYLGSRRAGVQDLDYVPRTRSSVYPAIPFQAGPDVRAGDSRRVRFEINVPFADALLWIDGVQTKQTGLQRILVTPPMEEDRKFTSTIKVQWRTKTGEMSLPREKTFEFVAGETVKHTFIE